MFWLYLVITVCSEFVPISSNKLPDFIHNRKSELQNPSSHWIGCRCQHDAIPNYQISRRKLTGKVISVLGVEIQLYPLPVMFICTLFPKLERVRPLLNVLYVTKHLPGWFRATWIFSRLLATFSLTTSRHIKHKILFLSQFQTL